MKDVSDCVENVIPAGLDIGEFIAELWSTRTWARILASDPGLEDDAESGALFFGPPVKVWL